MSVIGVSLAFILQVRERRPHTAASRKLVGQNQRVVSVDQLFYNLLHDAHFVPRICAQDRRGEFLFGGASASWRRGDRHARALPPTRVVQRQSQRRVFS